MKKRIMFVDDESNLLQGLKRSLRQKQKEWDISFFENGSEALECLKKSVFDVIVTDYRMPGMDGLELLEKVKMEHPDIIRILLTGQSESETFERAKELVHLYIPKPCNTDEIISHIDNEISRNS